MRSAIFPLKSVVEAAGGRSPQAAQSCSRLTARDVGRYPRVMVDGDTLSLGDNLDLSRPHMGDESGDLQHGLGSLKSHPMERRVSRMAKDVAGEIR
jgi:hypothetical protein